jgi:hypothetical protein
VVRRGGGGLTMPSAPLFPYCHPPTYTHFTPLYTFSLTLYGHTTCTKLPENSNILSIHI